MSCSSLQTTNSVVKSNNVIIVSSAADVINVTRFCVRFYYRRAYNGYIPYHANAIRLCAVLAGVLGRRTAGSSLTGVRTLYRVIHSADLYNLKRATPGPILDALGCFQRRCRRLLVRPRYLDSLGNGRTPRRIAT